MIKSITDGGKQKLNLWKFNERKCKSKVIETLKFEMNPCGWSLEVWVRLWTKGEKKTERISPRGDKL